MEILWTDMLKLTSPRLGGIRVLLPTSTWHQENAFIQQGIVRRTRSHYSSWKVVTRRCQHSILGRHSITLTRSVWSKDCAYGDSRVLSLTNPYLFVNLLSKIGFSNDAFLQKFLHLYDWILLLRVWQQLRQVSVGVRVFLLRLHRGM